MRVVLREGAHRATARSAPFQTRRWGQKAWWGALQVQRAGDAPVKLGVESAREPARTWE